MRPGPVPDPPDPSSQTDRPEGQQQRFARELLEILNELRVALPGVQMLFGFMLVAPFSTRFSELQELERGVFFAGFVATALASALLIAPSVYHRLHWRREIDDKERMLQTFTSLAVAGAVFLAIAMSCSIYVVTAFLFPGYLPRFATAISGIAFFFFWFALPLSRRLGAPKKRPIARSGIGSARAHGTSCM